ncbi:unnamed protein product, partial [Laminaria digitata]
PFPSITTVRRRCWQEDMLHGHTPWIVILVRKVAEWKEKHGGAMPDGKQRGEFKAR